MVVLGHVSLEFEVNVEASDGECSKVPMKPRVVVPGRANEAKVV